MSTAASAPFFERTPAPAHLVIPLQYVNNLRGNTYGLELASSWNITNRWKVSGSYSWLRVRLKQVQPAGGLVEVQSHEAGKRHSTPLRTGF